MRPQDGELNYQRKGAVARRGAFTPQGRLAHLRYQVLVTTGVFFGLFFIEYPPLFILGYWAWPYTVGYTAHKVISGLFILLNLGITQYAARRWRFFRRAPERDHNPAQVVPSSD